MPDQGTEIVVGHIIDGIIVIRIDGHLHDRIQDLGESLEKELVVQSVVVEEKQSTIQTICIMQDQPYTPEQIRIRVLNRCRQWITATVGDMVSDHNKVSLVETS